MVVSPISGAHESRHQRDIASGHSLKFSITAHPETHTASQPHKRAPFHLVQAVDFHTFFCLFRPAAPRATSMYIDVHVEIIYILYIKLYQMPRRNCMLSII